MGPLMGQSNTILVVEDERSIADSVSYALKTEGFTAVCCATGEEALRKINDETPLLVVLDVGLPDISGFEVCKRVRRFSEVPIVFLTARAEEIDRVLGLEIGGDDYVAKPFSPRELAARIKAVLRRTAEVRRPETTAIRDDRFAIDGERLRISFYGQPLELSRYEFRLLAILVRRPGRVYSREELMSIAWESPEMSLERTVDTHIKTLRAKLRVIAGDEDVIITHRGTGYSLKERE